MIKIAASQYCIDKLSHWDAYVQKSTKTVRDAKEKGAQLLLLPEYAGIEMVNGAQNDLELYTAIQDLLPNYMSLFQQLANEYQMYIQPGTLVVKNQEHYVNRAYFFGPHFNGFQDKLQLVSNEKEDIYLKGGKSQTIFKTSLGLIGIAVCYDAEFPELIRNFTQQGVKLILVPSYTPSMASFMRVYLSCRARAIENQCYVAMSSVIGVVNFSDVTENLTGQANIFTPIDTGFTDDGVLAQGNMNEVQMIVGDIDYEKIDFIRLHGQVHNFNDSGLVNNSGINVVQE